MSRSLKERMSGATVLAKMAVIGDDSVVSHHKSYERANCCKTCPMHNPNPSYSTIEKAENSLALASVSRHQHPTAASTGQCTACGCLLPFLVHVKDELAIQGMTQEIADKMPPQCWKLRIWMKQGNAQSDNAPGKKLKAGGCNC